MQLRRILKHEQDRGLVLKGNSVLARRAVSQSIQAKFVP